MAFDNNDWTLAATDDTTANEALETVEKVEHHFWADEEGAHVSVDETIGETTKNILLDSDSVDIREGENVLASFSENMVELGKNSSDAEIKMLDGKGTIKYEEQGGRLLMKSENNTTICSGFDKNIEVEHDDIRGNGWLDSYAGVSTNTYYFPGDADYASASLHASRSFYDTITQEYDVSETVLTVDNDDGVSIFRNYSNGNFAGGILTKGAPFTKLWSGSKTNGSVLEIPNFDKYAMYAVRVGSSTSTYGIFAIGVKVPSGNTTSDTLHDLSSWNLHCVASYDDGTSYTVRVSLSGTSATTVKIGHASQHKVDGSSGAQMYVKEIWGIL